MGRTALTVSHPCMVMVVAWPLPTITVRVASMVARPSCCDRVACLSWVGPHHEPASLPWHVARLSRAVGQGLGLQPLHVEGRVGGVACGG